MSTVHVPAIEAGASSPCHGRPLAGSPARVWCTQCGATYQAHPGEVVIVPDFGGDVAEAAARRAHELELERIRPTPRPPAEACGPVKAVEAAEHRRALEVATR